MRRVVSVVSCGVASCRSEFPTRSSFCCLCAFEHHSNVGLFFVFGFRWFAKLETTSKFLCLFCGTESTLKATWQTQSNVANIRKLKHALFFFFLGNKTPIANTRYGTHKNQSIGPVGNRDVPPWHGTQRVRRLSRPQSPPPSATARMWSACQKSPSLGFWSSRSSAFADLGSFQLALHKALSLSAGSRASTRVKRAWPSTPQSRQTPASRANTCALNWFPIPPLFNRPWSVHSREQYVELIPGNRETLERSPPQYAQYLPWRIARSLSSPIPFSTRSRARSFAPPRNRSVVVNDVVGRSRRTSCRTLSPE
mmetsp:Transcript_2693/g.6383  ORF Transcript_2693/g.6383 Transcript_2693/m.6383 type:complete len:310 (-) Transcript_2693:217-1146(-)